MRNDNIHPELVLQPLHRAVWVSYVFILRLIRPCEQRVKTIPSGANNRFLLPPRKWLLFTIFSFFFSLISLIADGPHHYHPACGHKGSSYLSPVHALQFFYRDTSSALLQLVNQWLNFTNSRSHAFRYERKNTNPTKVIIELTTSAIAGMQVTH